MPASTAARKSRWTAYELQEVEYLRSKIRRALAAPDTVQPSTLAGMGGRKPGRRAAGKARLANPRATYTVDTSHGQVTRLKPAHGQWATTTHATETRRPGYSGPLTWQSPRYSRAVYALQSHHIASIMARYSGSREMRIGSTRRLSARAAAAVATAAKVRRRAKIFATVILCGGNAGHARMAMGLSSEEWASSQARRTYRAVHEWLEDLDIESLLAWQREWSAPAGAGGRYE